MTEGHRPLRGAKVMLFLALVLPIAWHIGVREWDYQAAYSGVVVEKGMDYNFFFAGRRSRADLYIVLQDDLGKRSKRYLGTTRFYDPKVWNNIAVGSFIVKDRGYGEVPYEPGKKPPSRPASGDYDWLLLPLILLMGGFLVVSSRQLWNALGHVVGAWRLRNSR